MPVIKPPGGVVDWPANEGTLGVIGVAPWSTIEFCQAFYKLVSASKDWHYPRLIVDINTKLPSRGRHLELGEADFSPGVAASIRELADQGATVAIVVCNTAHVLFDRWAADAPIIVPNIIDETVRLAVSKGGHRLAALGSPSLAKYGLYADAAKRQGCETVELTPEQQNLVWAGISQVKVDGRFSPTLLSQFDKLATDLTNKGVDSIILGCTELSELKERYQRNNYRPIDSNEALAIAALRHLNVPDEYLAEDAKSVKGAASKPADHV